MDGSVSSHDKVVLSYCIKSCNVNRVYLAWE